MSLINLEQQVALENALKLAFIKLQQTGGFNTVNGVQTPDQTAHDQILDAIHSFDPAFSFGERPTRLKTAAVLRDELGALMTKYQNFGARDSEPMYHRERVIDAGRHGKPFPLKGDNPWELYSSMPGFEDVSDELTAKAHEYWQALARER